MDNGYILVSIAIMSAVTVLLRVIPFAAFSGKRRTPGVVIYLGKVLPFSIMGMLVVYCLKDTDFLGATHGIPEVIAVTVVVVVHLLKRNTVLSVIAGTVVYMLLVQFIF